MFNFHIILFRHCPDLFCESPQKENSLQKDFLYDIKISAFAFCGRIAGIKGILKKFLKGEIKINTTDNEGFWKLIDESRRANPDDNEAFFEFASRKFAELGDEQKSFLRCDLGIYTEIAAECVWLNMACKVINGYISDDTGLYFGLWVISRGKEVFFNALKNPDSLALIENIPFGRAEFEQLMSLGCEEECGDGFDEALLRQTDLRRKHIMKEIIFKEGGMYGNYDSFEDALKAIPETLPNLIKRARAENFNRENYI